MEFSKDIYCNGCKSFKPSFEFTSYGTKGVKQFKTCNNCRQRFEKRRNTLVEIKNCQADILEIIDIDFLSEIIINLLEDISSDNQELYLHCRVSNTSFNNVISTKEIADKIIEDILASKPRKNPDPLKQRDTPSMKRFTCDGTIKISIDKNTKISEVELRHKDLHTRPVNKST
ncbi:unnamed protein product [Rhizophagus irregularis]|nr:unnamed protein product [Rhizophagus irregularis]